MLVALVMVAALSHEGLGDQGQATDNGSASKLLVIPFKDMYQVYGTETSYRCPFTGKVHMLGYVTPSADDLLTDHLMLLLKNLGGYQVMLADQADPLLFASAEIISLTYYYDFYATLQVTFTLSL